MTLRYCVTLRPGALIKQHQKRRCDVCFAPCSYAGCTPFCGRHSRLSAESPPPRGAGPVHEQTRLVWSPNRPRIGCPTPNPHSIDRQSSIQVAICLKATNFFDVVLRLGTKKRRRSSSNGVSDASAHQAGRADWDCSFVLGLAQRPIGVQSFFKGCPSDLPLTPAIWSPDRPLVDTRRRKKIARSSDHALKASGIVLLG